MVHCRGTAVRTLCLMQRFKMHLAFLIVSRLSAFNPPRNISPVHLKIAGCGYWSITWPLFCFWVWAVFLCPVEAQVMNLHWIVSKSCSMLWHNRFNLHGCNGYGGFCTKVANWRWDQMVFPPKPCSAINSTPSKMCENNVCQKQSWIPQTSQHWAFSGI